MITIPQQQINWEQTHISGKDLQPEIVQQKIQLWEQADKNNPETYELLKDPTIYEYAFFKDQEGNPSILTAYQDAILNQAIQYDFTPNNKNKNILFKASNQIGKSHGLRAYARYLITVKENINIVFISNNLKASQYLLAELRREFDNSKFSNTWREDLGETANTTHITFEKTTTNKDGTTKKTLNRIICAPAGEGALGYPIHYLFLDEADFYEEGVKLFWKVFYPRTLKTKGQIILFSNPNPDIPTTESILEELWKKDLFKRKFHFNYLDAPWNTKEQFEIDKQNSPAHLFASTHLGERSDVAGAFFTTQELNNMLQHKWTNTLPMPNNKDIYVALDLGKMHDNTVISIGTTTEDHNHKYKNLDVEYIEILPLKTPYDKILDRIQEIRNTYEQLNIPIADIGYDATGQKTFEDFLKKEGIPATPIDFARKETNKTKLYNDFKLLAEQNKIKIVYTEQASKQLAGLQFKYTENKRLKVAHKTENTLDDIPDSIAILIQIAVTPHKTTPTATIIKQYNTEELTPEERNKKIQETIQKKLDERNKKIIQENNYKPQSLYNRYGNYY